MKAIVFNPYLDTLGGGDRYSLFVAISLVRLGYDTQIAWDKKETLVHATDRFGFNLSSVKLNKVAYRVFSKKHHLIQKYFITHNFDLIFWLSDASIPFLFAKKNFVHIQTPFTKIGGNSLLNKLKFLKINKFIYNSNFTRSVLEKSLPSRKGVVLYPPIDTDGFRSRDNKKNIILSVARFDSPSHPKRQDILLSAFSRLSQKTKKKYTLILAGGSKGKTGTETLKQLATQSKGLSVKILPNPNFTQLKKLYSEAKFFWHAAGYGIDEQLHPELVEHFGMTTVEAMSAGAVPIVLGKGGQKEIITPSSGFTWQNIDILIDKTLELINDEKKLETYFQESILRAKSFSSDKFLDNLKDIIRNN